MQVSLFGQRVQEINEKFEKAEEPWKDVCCRACWFAEGKRCVCRCGGRYHGKGRKRSFEPPPSMELLKAHTNEAWKYCLECKHFDECELKPTLACSLKETKKNG